MSEGKIEKDIEKQSGEIDVYGATFRTRIFKMHELLKLRISGKIGFVGGEPFRKWNKVRKSIFIETLILGYPPGAFIIDGSDAKWLMVEGGELLEAVYEFVSNRFPLVSGNFNLSSYNGFTFQNLPLGLQRSLLNLDIIATVIKPGTTDINRLGIYYFALQKLKKESKLWECVESIYPKDYQSFTEFAEPIGISDLHLLWTIMVALFFRKEIKNGEPSLYEKIDNLSFPMFECMLMKSFPDFQKFFRDERYEKLEKTARFISDIFDTCRSSLSLWSQKKRNIFIMVMALKLSVKKTLDPESFLKKYRKKWTLNENIGKGNLYKDYKKKIKEIYQAINI